MKIALKFSLVVISFLTASCEMGLNSSRSFVENTDARALFYIHSNARSQTYIKFTISGISIQTRDGSWIKVMETPFELDSSKLAGRQLFLKKTSLAPGVYKAIRLGVSKASISGSKGYVNLALPEDGGVVLSDINLKLGMGESFVISLEWNPNKSVANRYLFKPDIKAEMQEASSRGVMLFVSNSGSNYITVIDRELERVIGAVSVGDGPMGMAIDAGQDVLYVVNSVSRSISVVDIKSLKVIDNIPLTMGIRPTDVVFVPDADSLIDGKIYVINRDSNSVTVIDALKRRVLKTISVGTSPSAIVSDTERKEVYVSNERSNTMSIISTVNDSLITDVVVGNRPTGLVLRRDKDMIYVLNEASNSISVVSPSLRKSVGTISVTAPPARGVEGFNGRLFITDASADTVKFFNSFDVLTDSVGSGVKPMNLAGDEQRNRLYVTNYGEDTVSLIDPIGEAMVKKLTVGEKPYGVVFFEK